MRRLQWYKRGAAYTDMAALGYGYDCIGLRIWLRWVTDMTASGYEYDCIGLQILLRKLTETYL